MSERIQVVMRLATDVDGALNQIERDIEREEA